MISRQREVGKIRSQLAGNEGVPGRGVIAVVEVSEMGHGVRTLPHDQIQHPSGVGAITLVSEESDLEFCRGGIR